MNCHSLKILLCFLSPYSKRRKHKEICITLVVIIESTTRAAWIPLTALSCLYGVILMVIQKGLFADA